MSDYEYHDTHTNEGLTDHELHERFDEMLDECYSDVTVAEYTFTTSRALKELDPIAYRCGFHDWVSGEVEDGALGEGNPPADDEDDEDEN